MNRPMLPSPTEFALQVATEAHQGQVRKFNGEPYIMHPMRVALSVPGLVIQYWPEFHKEFGPSVSELVQAALLHDVIEDTDITADKLRELGFTNQVVNTVVILSRSPGDLYRNYINRIEVTQAARVIKIADVRDNTRDLPPDDGMWKRYTKTYKQLTGKG